MREEWLTWCRRLWPEDGVRLCCSWQCRIHRSPSDLRLGSGHMLGRDDRWLRLQTCQLGSMSFL